MNPVRHHIREHLPLPLDTDKDLEQVLEYMDVQDQSEKALLSHFNSILDFELNFDRPELKYTHLHLPTLPPRYFLLILEFLVIKFYFKHLLKDNNVQQAGSSFLIDQIKLLEKRLERKIELSSNSSNKEYKRKKEERRKFKALKEFYSRLSQIDKAKDKVPIPGTLVNTLKVHIDPITDVFNDRWFAKQNEHLNVAGNSWDPMESSYVVLNSRLSLKEIDSIGLTDGESLLDHLENIILFDCEGKSIHKKFNNAELTHLNSNEGTAFRNLLVVSFDSRCFYLNKAIRQLSRISSNYFRRSEDLNFPTYLMTQDEVDLIVSNSHTTNIHIEFIGENSESYNHLLEMLNNHETLSELSSIKLRNIYSLCINDQIKEIILDDIFSIDSPAQLITHETKIELRFIDSTEKEEIKDILDEILSLVIKSELQNRILENTLSDLCLILPFKVLKHTEILHELKVVFGKRLHFATWKEIDDIKRSNVLILDYRDAGHYLFNIYPNIIETRLRPDMVVNGVFLNMFFRRNFDSCNYSYQKFLVEKILDHPIRRHHFEWEELITKLLKLKPTNGTYDHLWDLDNEYESTSDHNAIVVEFANRSCRTFYPSQLLVAKDEDHLFTLRAEELLENENEGLLFQPLEALYEDLNLFKVSPEEETEIKRLNERYGINETQASISLWKLLLKRKAEEIGIDTLYDKLGSLTNANKVNLVSKQYFINEWLDPESVSLIPRTKKMFKILYDYLNLPTIYFRVLLKKRAKERQQNRQNNSRMNAIFIHLIKSGVFENGEDGDRSSIWSDVARHHGLEEVMGLTLETLDVELSALVDLSKSNLKLERITKVEIRKS